jgi:hypothetical protein
MSLGGQENATVNISIGNHSITVNVISGVSRFGELIKDAQPLFQPSKEE